MKGVCLEYSTSPRPAALTAESMTRQPWLTATFANDGFATGTQQLQISKGTVTLG